MVRHASAKSARLPWVDYLKEIEYVIYCRSSSDESSDKQQSSIPQQMRACVEYAERAWLPIKQKPDKFEFEEDTDLKKEDADEEWNTEVYQQYRSLYIVKERASAKPPRNRPKWRRLIEMVKNGEIRGILSYSPDRMARNMVDWWEILNLVTDSFVKLEYTTFQFENNSSGRMLLWFWFVFSTMYSDKLSEDSVRGSKDTLSKGKSLWFKHWYIINDQWFHEPHPVNFPLICEAFKMKLDGKKHNDILKYLKDSWYKREYADSDKETFISNLADVFWESFYYGLANYKTYGSVNLIEKNPHFAPAVSRENWLIIQEMLWRRDPHAKKQKKDETEMAMPFPAWMIQANTGEELVFYITNKKRIKLRLEKEIIRNPDIIFDQIVRPAEIRYEYRGDDKNYMHYSEEKKEIVKFACSFKKIEDGILEFLEKRFYVPDEQYESFRKFVWEKVKENGAHYRAQLKRVTLQETTYNKEIEELSIGKARKHIEEEDAVRINKRIEKLNNLLVILKQEREKYNRLIKGDIIEQVAFLEFLRNAHQYYKNATYVQKRVVVEKLFSNIQINPDLSLRIELKRGLNTLDRWYGSATENRTPVPGMRILCPNH
jgi:DNA invertase Pin-like site-specific DNA recombinase